MKDVVILGSGGHAKVILDACLSAGRNVRGFLDTDKESTGPQGYALLGSDDYLLKPGMSEEIEVAVGAGLPKLHRKLTEYAQNAGSQFATILHRATTISPSAILGAGCFVNAGAVINADARIGLHCIINTSVSVDHDCILSDFVNIAPGAVLAGGVVCKSGVFVGAGATITPGVTLGENAVIAAGAVVIDDVPDGGRVGGVPALPL